MNPAPLNVELGDRTYPIRFGPGAKIVPEAADAVRSAGGAVRVVCDQGVIDAHPRLPGSAGFSDHEIFVVPSGETGKSVERYEALLRFLAREAVNRDGALFAIGGGVVGDLAGFAAATYLRGIAFHAVPTTLLAMVDSSVGGKTGINLPEGKNLAGAFWQPRSVAIDTTLLATLPPREFAAGMAEVVKYGLLADADLLEELESAPELSAAAKELPAIVRRCCGLKAEIVADDETENAAAGGRALLNLGHTFAHAIENVAGYGEYLHGEAVAVGLWLAARLSVDLGYVADEIPGRVETLLGKYRLPTRLRSPLEADALMEAMRRDKKNRAGKMRLIALRHPGDAITVDGVEPGNIRDLWREAGAR